MLYSDIGFEVTYLSHYNEKGVHHGKSRENRTRNKIRWEDGGVPSWNHRCGKVKGYDGVYGKYQWCRQTGQYQGNFLKTLPIFGATRPTETQQAVNFLLERLYRPVTDHGEIRQKTCPPEHQ